MTVVAIDGPAGAGKSSVARAVARRLGFRYLDTGALYRAVTVAVLDAGVDVDDEVGCVAVAKRVKIEFSGHHVVLDGRDVTDRIRHPDVTAAVSRVARHPEVRSALVPLQRDLAATGSVVMEGRDIAATIAPDAEIKVFLTASSDERARRRSLDLGAPESQIERIRTALEARDREDSTRASSPLAFVDGAILVDSTHKDLEAVVAEVVALVRAKVAPVGEGDD